MSTSRFAVHAYVLCAGRGERWNEYLGQPKQLISFGGQSLVARLADQLRRRGLERIYIVSNDARLQLPGLNFLQPESSHVLAQTILSTRETWSQRSCFFLGDVYYTDSAIDVLVEAQEPLIFFGRPWAGRFIHCDHGEMFAASCDDASSKIFEQVLQSVSNDGGETMRGNMWDIYHISAGLPLNSGRADGVMFRVIDDVTNDFDSPNDYLKNAWVYRMAQSRHAFIRLMLAGLLHARGFLSRSRSPVTVENVAQKLQRGCRKSMASYR